MLKLFAFLYFICACMGRITKLTVPYDYLLTLNRVSGPNSLAQTSFNQSLINWFKRNCKDGTCFLAVYNNSTSSEEMFQILDKKENQCFNTTTGNCLLFNRTQYSYSFIYEQENREKTEQCTIQRADTDFLVPKCDTDWESFVRENGKTWCYKILGEQKFKFNDAQVQCQTHNANLYGYESDREFDEFHNYSKKVLIDKFKTPSPTQDFPTSRHVWIGAMRTPPDQCGSNSDPQKRESCRVYHMFWQNEVSRTPYLHRPTFDGNGDCLAYVAENVNLDDNACECDSYVACGKYADDRGDPGARSGTI